MNVEVMTFPRIPTRQSNFKSAGYLSGLGDGGNQNRLEMGALEPMWKLVPVWGKALWN